MFKRLVVATDLSPASYAVVSCLSGLKAYGAEQCLLLQCMSFTDATSTALSYHTSLLQKMLKEQKDILEKQGFTVETRTVVGAPKQEIVRIATKEDYELIVVGTQGHSLAEEKLLGGVAYGVIIKTVKPVLVVPIKKKAGEENACEPVNRCNLGEHILFATDFSQVADNAFTYVEQMAAHGGRKITLIHVQDKVKLGKHLEDRLEEFNKIDTERLERLKMALKKLGVTNVRIELPYGFPKNEILTRIREDNVSLVVMGSQGRSFMGEIFLGSVSHAVARHSEAPVLLIPAIR